MKTLASPPKSIEKPIKKPNSDKKPIVQNTNLKKSVVSPNHSSLPPSTKSNKKIIIPKSRFTMEPSKTKKSISSIPIQSLKVVAEQNLQKRIRIPWKRKYKSWEEKKEENKDYLLTREYEKIKMIYPKRMMVPTHVDDDSMLGHLSRYAPQVWDTIHAFAFAYPDEPNEEIQKHAVQFYESIAHLFPCEICREHFKEMFYNPKLKIQTQSREALSQWTVRLHNIVNERLGKKIVSFEEMERKWIGYQIK